MDNGAANMVSIETHHWREEFKRIESLDFDRKMAIERLERGIYVADTPILEAAVMQAEACLAEAFEEYQALFPMNRISGGVNCAPFVPYKPDGSRFKTHLWKNQGRCV